MRQKIHDILRKPAPPNWAPKVGQIVIIPVTSHGHMNSGEVTVVAKGMVRVRYHARICGKIVTRQKVFDISEVRPMQ